MNNTIKVCPNCGSTVTGVTEDLPMCPYCGTRLAATQGMNSNWANSAKINNNTFVANQNTNMNGSQSDGMAIAGFVLGIASLLGVISPIIGWICGILGFIFSNNSIKKGSSDSKCKIARVLSVIGILLGVIMFIIGLTMTM